MILYRDVYNITKTMGSRRDDDETIYIIIYNIPTRIGKENRHTHTHTYTYAKRGRTHTGTRRNRYLYICIVYIICAYICTGPVARVICFRQIYTRAQQNWSKSNVIIFYRDHLVFVSLPEPIWGIVEIPMRPT